MRMSPLLHPLAVLRTTAGLTQKQMGDLVNRAARTIQSIELRKMPLTDELALRIAEVTGVDEAWLAEGNPQTPPRKGLTLLQAGRGPGGIHPRRLRVSASHRPTALHDLAWGMSQ